MERMGNPSLRGAPADFASVRSSLRESEERFRLLVESVHDYAIFLLDPTGHVASWNAGAERIKGYRAEDIIGQHFSRFYPQDDIDAGKCEMELAEAARVGRFEDEGWRLRKDGSRFWANVIITALRDENGALVGYAKVTRDLTDRREAEQERIRIAQIEEAHRVTEEFLARERAARRAAEEARSSLAITLRSIGDAVIATDAEGRITLLNPVAERLTGWSADEALGKRLHEVFSIVNEHSRAAVDSPVDRVLREGVVVGLANHTLLVARNGSETPIADSGAPVRDEDGALRGVVLVFRDVTEESRSAERRNFLADATATLTSSLDYRETLARVARLAVPRFADWCAVDVVENGGGCPVRVAVAHADPAKLHLAAELDQRYPPDPNASTGVPNVIRTGRSEFYADIPDELLVAGTVDAEHLRIARELGLRSAIVVPLSSGTRVFGALTLVSAESGRRYTERDVAFAEDLGRRGASAIENARLYAAEQRAREAADAANRAKDDFLASVSHELRTPLNAILGWARLLGAGLSEEKRARAAATIERNAVAMAQLIEDLLDVSRIVTGKMRLEVGTVDLALIVEAALESAKPAADAKAIRIEAVFDSTPGIVSGDSTRLQQVIWNLLSNAVKFTGKGGRIDVELQRGPSSVTIAVTDTGKGIAPEFLEHVFEPFRQAEGARGGRGLGLGLAICRNIVELHGGRIEAKSEGEGRGARFEVTLPLATGASGQIPSVAPASSSTAVDALPQLNGLRVLVVEDEDDARELLRVVLEQCGSRVSTAASVGEAMAAFEQDPPDVLLSDIGLRGESGYDLIRRIRALPPERGGRVPAAALTAYARGEDRRKALSAGFMLHVAKPVEPSELVTVVAALARYAMPRH
jgi:PAS domain S-box-containing protein